MAGNTKQHLVTNTLCTVFQLNPDPRWEKKRIFDSMGSPISWKIGEGKKIGVGSGASQAHGGVENRQLLASSRAVQSHPHVASVVKAEKSSLPGQKALDNGRKLDCDWI
jgi:hypothetical protein